MLETLSHWLATAFDGLTVVAALAALIVYVVVYVKMSKTGLVTIEASVLRTWMRVNLAVTLLVLLNAARWFVLNDLFPIFGYPNGTVDAIDNLTWAMCDLLMVLMPLLLVSRMMTVADALIPRTEFDDV